MTDTTQPALPALDDDVRVLRTSSAAAMAHATATGDPWLTAPEIACIDPDSIAVVEAEHIAACDPARIARVLDALEHLQRQVKPYRGLVAALQAERTVLQRSAAAASEAVTTLASEREANARLTDELEQLQRERDEARGEAAILRADLERERQRITDAYQRVQTDPAAHSTGSALGKQMRAYIAQRDAAGAQSGAPQPPDPDTI